MKSKDYLSTLKKVRENDQLAFVHPAIDFILKMYEELFDNEGQLKVKIEGFSEKPNNEDNEFVYYINNKKLFVPFNEELVHRAYGFNKIIPKITILENGINLTINEILTSSRSKYINIYKAILNYPEAKYFFNNFFLYKISTARQINFKLTGMCIDLSNAIFKFVLSQTPFSVIYNVFNYKKNLERKASEKKFVLSLVEILFGSEKNKIRKLLSDHTIKNTFLQEFICENLKNIFLKKCQLNTIYDENIKEIIQRSTDYTTKIHDLNFFNDLIKIDLGLGYYFIDLLIHFQVFTVSENEHQTKILTPVDQVIAETSLNRSINEPFLSYKHFYEIDQKEFATANFELIHDNHRIDLELKGNSYMHKFDLFTALSVDVDYLIVFLNLLNKGFDEDDKLDLLQINKNHIKTLRKFSNPFLTLPIDRIFSIAFDFNNTVTNKHLLEILEDTVKDVQNKCQLLIEENIDVKQESDLAYKTYLQYKPLLVSIINKISQRRYLFINLLFQAIKYSVFKYIIHPTFMDTRGRVYSSGVALNIFTSPLAKSFIKLYDNAKGQHPNNIVLTRIKHCLTFEQTRTQIDSLMRDVKNNIYKEKHALEIYKYICSYLTISIDEFKDLISSIDYNTDQSLYDKLKTIIKKSKKLHYVHSLVNYERLRLLNMHNTLICNYIQKDASSSGLQMMSILFRNKELATISNLIGNKNYDIYAAAASNCVTVYEKMKSFVVEGLSWFDCDTFLDGDLDMKLIKYTYEDYDQITKCEDFTQYLIFLLTLDIEESSITNLFLKFLKNKIVNNEIRNNKSYKPLNLSDCKFLVTYLSNSQLTLIIKYTELLDFKNYEHVLDYIFCLRYALRQIFIAEKIINVPPEQWAIRDLTKNHVMTALYMSTAYGRKEAYIKYLQDTFVLSKDANFIIGEFASFLEQTTTQYLASFEGLQLLNKFIEDLCQNNKQLTISNRNFEIKIAPKITKDLQVSCSSHFHSRGFQLVIKKRTETPDYNKLKSMFLANLAHSMDSDLMHHFVELCLKINTSLDDMNSNFMLSYERNHDCFLLNDALLLKIFVEEAYLKLCSQDNMLQIKEVNPKIVSKYLFMNLNSFLNLLNPINPNFIK